MKEQQENQRIQTREEVMSNIERKIHNYETQIQVLQSKKFILENQLSNMKRNTKDKEEN